METASSFSVFTLLLMLLLFFGSLAIFVVLERRWTTQRKWVALSDWARLRGMRMRRSGEVPPALAGLQGAQPWVRLMFQKEGVAVLQLQTSQPEPRGWNVLVIANATWEHGPAALRPANQAVSLMDLLNLPVMPTSAGTERFLALSNESRSAKALVLSKTRALLPADVGLLRAQQWLVFDFSTRPFDPIELDRLLAIGQQITQMG